MSEDVGGHDAGIMNNGKKDLDRKVYSNRPLGLATVSRPR